MTALGPGFFDRSVHEVAPELVGCELRFDGVGGVIVEVESYERNDPACHAYRGATKRNAPLFGPPGHAYVYLSYGIHTCLNFVCEQEGSAAAVLIRAIEPRWGVDTMRRRRRRRDPRELCSGPGKLTEALGVALSENGASLSDPPFAVLLPDDLMIGSPPVLAQMAEQFAALQASIVAVQEVPAEHTRRYGIVGGREVGERLVEIDRIVEKPAPEVAPSRLGVAGRYVLTPRVFDEIAAQPRGVGGEIQLTDGIAGLLKHEKVFAYRYQGRRYDCGSKEGFLQANVELALAHKLLGPGFRDFLRGLEI